MLVKIGNLILDLKVFLWNSWRKALLMRKSKAPGKSPEKWTSLSLAFYNAPSLHIADYIWATTPETTDDNSTLQVSVGLHLCSLAPIRNLIKATQSGVKDSSPKSSLATPHFEQLLTFKLRKSRGIRSARNLS